MNHIQQKATNKRTSSQLSTSQISNNKKRKAILSDESSNKAATNIQRIARGHLTRKVIKKNQAATVIQTGYKKGKSLINQNHTCPISLESINMHNSTLTACGHVFDREYLLMALQKSAHCPLCRNIISTVNTSNTNINSQLLDAAENGDTEIIQSFINSSDGLNADLNLQIANDDQESALHLATYYGHRETAQVIADALLMQNESLDSTDNDGWTPVQFAAGEGYTDILTDLIARGANLEAVNSEGETALHIALNYNHLETVEKLIELGANLNAIDNSKYTPLHLAVQKGKTQLVKMFLNANADINLIDINGCKALHWAASYGCEEITKELIKAGADLESTNNEGATALHIAVQYGHLDYTEQLLNSGANPSAVITTHLWTPLHLAALFGRTEIIPLIAEALEPSNNLNATDNNGSTALHLASKEGKAATVQALIAAKVNLNDRDNDGRTALELAELFGHNETAQILQA